MAKLPDKFGTKKAVVVVSSGGHKVRPVDVNGVALDDGTQSYSVAHPVLETDTAGTVKTNPTQIVGNPKAVTVDPTGTPVVLVLADGTTLGTSLGSLVINPNLGINFTSMDYFEGTRTYSNLIYGSGWTISGGTGPQNVALPAGHTDANGWVTSLPGDYTTVNRVLSIPISSASMVAKWTGNGSAHISLSGSLVSGVDNSVANQTTFTYSTSFSNPNWYAAGSWVSLSYTFNAADPLKNLDVREVSKSSSQIFETDFMSAAEGYAVVRPISGWQVGVAATGTQTPPTITWATRNQPGFADYTINDGVPVEDMVSFANQASANPWFCMPWGADDTYITNFATYVRDNLVSTAKIYVENDNEVWNYGFAGTWAAKREGLSEGLGGVTAGVTVSSVTFSGTTATVTTSSAHGLGGDDAINLSGASPSQYNTGGWVDKVITGANTFTYQMASTPATNATTVGTYSKQPITLSVQRRYAEKTAHVMGLWSTVFAGQTNRIVRVAAFQNADTGNPPATLAWNSNLLANAIDAVATAPYWGGDTSSAEYSGATADTALNTLLPADIAQTIGWAKTQYATAQSFGKRYIAYEGGQTMTGSNVTLLQAIERDSRMYNLYGTFLSDWLTKCGGDNICLTNIAGPINQFGAWGQVEFIGQTVSLATTPKQQLVNDWRNGIRLPQTITGTLSCSSNSANGNLVGTVTGFYPGSMLSIQSTGPSDGSGLAINSTTGAVTVGNSANLPATGSYSITVRETNAAFSAGHNDTVLTWTVMAALNNTHAYRYYRFTLDTPNTNNGDIWIREVEIMAVPGGSDTTFGMTASASSSVGSNVPAGAIDDALTVWQVSGPPAWLQIDYGSTSGNWIAANQFTMTCPIPAAGPVNFHFQGSDDGSTFTTLKTITNTDATAAQTGWTSNPKQTWTI